MLHELEHSFGYPLFDRIGRGTIRIPRVNLSVFGTTQPQRISAYIRG